MASSDLARSSSIRSHQQVPRKPLPADPAYAGQVTEHVARIERRLSQVPDKSDSISSWISEQLQPLQNPNLPLTPPALSSASSSNRNSLADPKPQQEEQEEQEERPATPDTAVRQGPSTPSLQRSPPTPDQTPPKAARQPSNALKPGTPESRKPSSTAGSFITAQEQLSVDHLPESEADASFHTPETHERLQDPRARSAVGLGLGLETPDGSKTPTMHSPRIVGETAIVEPWLDHDAGIDDDPFTVTESLAVQEVEQERRLGKELLHPLESTPTQRPAHRDFQAAFERDSSVHSQTPPNQQGSSSPAEQVSRPTSNDSDFIHVDKKRLSGLSTQSQVVQAFVLSTPKKQRQRLRHSSKNESLRSASSPVPTSNRSSLTSSGSKPRPLHRTPKMNECPNRASLNSDSGISMGSDTRTKIDDSVGWHDIPGLRSSLRRSSEKERSLARKYSDLARRRSVKRPSTAPEGDKPKPSPRSQRQRSSSANPRPLASEPRGRRTADYPPVIPPRSSSLSAQTSQHNSRATSLTSNSLDKHNLQQHNRSPRQSRPAPAQSSPQTMQIARSAALPEIRFGPAPPRDEEERPSNEDAQVLQRRSLMTTTPFSGVSIPTSTPGPMEVNEATVVNIYPHSNTSVLVVQQFAQLGSNKPRLLTSRSGNVSIKLDNSTGRPRANIASLPTNSPARQTPPSRPLIPAPAVLLSPPTPSQAIGESVSRSSSRKYPPVAGKISMVRRVLSTKRYSEGVGGSPGRQLVVRRQSLQGPGQAPKLSPFWRPRAFWNDVSDVDSDAEEPDYFVRNTLGMPQVRLMNGPGSLSRRIGSLRRRKQQQQAEQDAAAKAELDGAERRVGILARLKNTRVTPFASLAEAIEKLRTRRAETQIDKQRDHLRQQIGPPVLAFDDSHHV